MKRCAIIGYFEKNEYRKKLAKDLISYFNQKNIDVILASSDNIPAFDGVKNYITLKNVVEENYTTVGLFQFFIAANKKFIQLPSYKNSNINPHNYFVKQHQITSNYAKMLGYSHYYFLEVDMVINKSHFEKITSDNWDHSKLHLYTFKQKEHYMLGLLHGDLNIACKVWSNENLDYISSLSKTKQIFVTEQALYEIAQKHLDEIVIHDNVYTDIFEQYNTCSIRNTATIFFDPINKVYHYLQYKGDHYNNQFSAQLCDENEKVLVEHHMKHRGVWFTAVLENYKTYIIKYYEGTIEEEYLSKITKIYTDPENIELHNNLMENLK